MKIKNTTAKNNSPDACDTKLDSTKEENIYSKHGYQKLNTLCSSLQGELLKAKQLITRQNVVIKKTDKSLFNERVAIEDEMRLCVSENIVKEALILQHLTVHNHCIGGYIIQFIDFFESDTSHYLVLEYIETETNLKQFIQIAHQHISKGLLKLNDYKRTIKYLCWQLIVTLKWLHDVMNCCHLDLCCENIMLKNCNFISQKDGYFKINPKISIKLVDFGVAEIFSPKPNGAAFKCNKQGLSLHNESYLAPNVFANEIYDASSADMWSVGMILFECLTAKRLYSAMDVYQYLCACYCPNCSSATTMLLNNGYCALTADKLEQYLTNSRKYNSYLPIIPMQLLTGLLNKESNRLNARNVLQHEWFRSYFEAYSNRIETKTKLQKEKQSKQTVKIARFPFYKLGGV